MPIIDYPFTGHCPTYTTPKPAVPVIVRNPANGIDLRTWALIDTGADATTIPEFVAKQVYHEIRNHKVKKDFLSGFGGSVMVYYHTFQIDILQLDASGTITDTPAISIPKRRYAVAQHLDVIVLGEEDFLRKYKLTIDYRKKILSIE